MNSTSMDDKIISALLNTGLNHEESLVYKTLINYGNKGATVRQLKSDLPIERTTIYSILRRLVVKGQVFEKKPSETSNVTKIFTCLEPSKFFKHILSKKKEEVKNFEDDHLIFTKTLQNVYLKKTDLSYINLDKYIRPYINPLLKKNWEVYSQVVEKTIGVDIYEYQLNYPKSSRLTPYCVLNVYNFDDNFLKNISLSENFKLDLSYLSDKLFLKDLSNDINKNFILYFYIKRLENRIGHDDMLNKYKMLDNFQIREVDEKFLGKPYPSLVFEVISKKGTNPHELMKIVLVPLKNKLYCLWAESVEILKEMHECILAVKKQD